MRAIATYVVTWRGLSISPLGTPVSPAKCLNGSRCRLTDWRENVGLLDGVVHISQYGGPIYVATAMRAVDTITVATCFTVAAVVSTVLYCTCVCCIVTLVDSRQQRRRQVASRLTCPS